MTGYDGPSIFKRNTSDTPSGNEDQRSKHRQGFENPHRKNLPKGIQTRADIQKEAQTYMQTSPTQHKESKKTARFKNKYIPPSLQQNNIDEIKEKNEWLYEELTKRLAKDASTYLFFEEEGAEFVEQQERAGSNSRPVEKRQVSKKKAAPARKLKDKQTKLKKIKKIEKKMQAQQKKPTTGLQRSLSNILEEEQAVLKNQEGHLNSLFTEKKRN